MDTIKAEHLQIIGNKAPAVQPVPITMCLDLTKRRSKYSNWGTVFRPHKIKVMLKKAVALQMISPEKVVRKIK